MLENFSLPFHSAAFPVACERFRDLDPFPTVGHGVFRGVVSMIGWTETWSFLGNQGLDESGVCRFLDRLTSSPLSTISGGTLQMNPVMSPIKSENHLNSDLPFCCQPRSRSECYAKSDHG
jgi:hypothetical protein